MRRCLFNLVVAAAALLTPTAWAAPPGLLFHVSFDRGTADADVAAGGGRSTLKLEPARHFVDGVRGKGLLQRAGDRCSYPLARNFDSTHGTLSMWVKPLNWDGGVNTFRHFLVVPQGPTYVMLAYLYPIGDRAVVNYIKVHGKTPAEATWRAGAPVDMFKRAQWTHLATTWSSKEVRVYANGRRVGRGLVAAPLPKLEQGTFAICPVQYWKHPRWSDPAEQTVCDEVRLFGRALADDEILDLYAHDLPGGVKGLEPKLVVALEPSHSAKTIAVSVRAAHLDEAWRVRFAKGTALALTVHDPEGKVIFSHTGALGDGRFVVRVPAWADGAYVAEAKLSAGGAALTGRAALTKPPTPWLPAQRDWRADRVLEPWTALKREGTGIRYWNGEVTLGGGLPSQITSGGQALLTDAIRLAAGRAVASWAAPRLVEEKPYRITVEGMGTLGALAASYRTLMEFDGLIRADITLTPPAGGCDLASLAIELPIRADVARYYRNPTCQEWDGQSLTEKEFLPYAWLGTTERGLSWFMESSANWRVGEGQPAMTLRREGNAVVVRLHLISGATRITKPLAYTIGFEATPVRPLPRDFYTRFLASGPQIKGGTLFIYGWRTQISYLNGRLLAHDPAKHRQFIDKWRAKGKETLSYTCTQCTANISPEYTFFADEWNQPYGAAFSGYKRVPDDAPYSMVGVCPRCSFADFLVWCVRQHIARDWGGGIYTDIDGTKPCDNRAHGCGFIDAFGRSGRTWPLYAHRALSRRIYAACQDAGKLYFSHAHSRWFAPYNAFNHGWCPGEQYSSKLLGKPHFYMDDIPDRVWRSEFHSPTTGVMTFLLPEIGRLGDKQVREQRGPSECCIAAAMAYGVPLWVGALNRQVAEEVWAAQQAFGMRDAVFVPFWKQTEIACPDRDIRISLWKKPGTRLVVVANFGDREKKVELRLARAAADARFGAAWQAGDLAVADGMARLTLPAKRGALLTVAGLPEKRGR